MTLQITPQQYQLWGNSIMRKYLPSYYKDKDDIIGWGILRAIKTIKTHHPTHNVFVYNAMLSGMRNYTRKIRRWNSIIPNKNLPVSINNLEYPVFR